MVTMRTQLLVVVSVVAMVGLGSGPDELAADPILTAKAVVSGTTVRHLPATKNVKRTAGAKGVAIAGAAVYTPFEGDYKVSTAPGGDAGNTAANEKQKKAIQSMLDGARRIHDGKVPPPKRAEELAEDFAEVFVAEFKSVEKGKDKPLIAKTKDLKTPAEEFARAEAKQTLTPINNTKESPLSYKAEENLISQVKQASKEKDRKPAAVAFGLNDDPIAIEWDLEAGLRLELDQLSFDVETTGRPSSAVTVFYSDAAFMNGSLDLEADRTSATPLYELLLFAYSFDGGAVFFDAFLDTFGNAVSDSAGNSGLAAVQTAVADHFHRSGSHVGFDPGYFFDVRIPGAPTKSTIFLRDAAAAMATVPEPSSTTFVAMTLLAGWSRRMWRARRMR